MSPGPNYSLLVTRSSPVGPVCMISIMALKGFKQAASPSMKSTAADICMHNFWNPN